MTRRPTTAARRAGGLLREARRRAEARRLELAVRRSAKVRGAALLLHAVGPRAGRHQFELDPPFASARLDALAGYLVRRYRVVPAGELVAAANARRAGEAVPVAITFDDDLPSHLEQAAPILGRRGAAATAFLCGTDEPFWWQLLQAAIDSEAIGARTLGPAVEARLVEAALRREPGAIGALGKAIEDLPPPDRDAVAARLREAVPEPPALLSADGRERLRAAGWEIGFHSRRHDLMTKLDDDALRAALVDGRAAVGNGGVRTFAYPHGKATARESRAAREAGYVAAFTGRAEVLTEATDIHLIGRLQPRGASLGEFAIQLARALAGA
jgi:peptidoglycan/xylan/chitin deacetylase (PgdA/CDA1 family)